MSEEIDPGKWYVSQEIAALLRISDETLEYWRRVGGGPAYVRLPSRKIRYLGRDLLAWLEAHRRRSTSDPGPALRLLEGRRG